MQCCVFLRKANATDIRAVFSLSNEAYVRRYSLNQEPIDWNKHVDWFTMVLSDPNSIFFIVSDSKDQFLGQIRFKIDGEQATVSISLSSAIRGQGYSSSLLSESISKLLQERKEVNEVIAHILEDNTPSVKLFTKVGFCLIDKQDGLLKYVYTRKE